MIYSGDPVDGPGNGFQPSHASLGAGCWQSTPLAKLRSPSAAFQAALAGQESPLLPVTCKCELAVAWLGSQAVATLPDGAAHFVGARGGGPKTELYAPEPVSAQQHID